MANAADRTAMGVRKKQRLQWSERATWTLIKLWEDNLHSLRAQKHNGDVHASIAGALTSAGVPRTKEQVHTKIENFGHTYRRCLKQLATGSSPASWPFFTEVHRFLGSLLVNDPSLMEEAGSGIGTTSSSASVEELIFGMMDSSSSSYPDV
ncbi:uncharacterized protein LOC119459337 [Dermacentor silvarum]|uniref:uncharacterized protein LOC119459337 n=1 Tax=Dermacentor silvarum TaxID=543639 RepID=UPI0018977439|nr:uncharacterized protein LOC119459337 [Dermacentor silvarum]